MKYRIQIVDGYLTIDASVKLHETERLRVAIVHAAEALRVCVEGEQKAADSQPFTDIGDDDVILTSSALRKSRN